MTQTAAEIARPHPEPAPVAEYAIVAASTKARARRRGRWVTHLALVLICIGFILPFLP